MKIPYLNVEMCENFLVVCNAGVSCYRPQILSSIWALIWASGRFSVSLLACRSLFFNAAV